MALLSAAIDPDIVFVAVHVHVVVVVFGFL
jgi:hypothetical protein